MTEEDRKFVDILIDMDARERGEGIAIKILKSRTPKEGTTRPHYRAFPITSE